MNRIISIVPLLFAMVTVAVPAMAQDADHDQQSAFTVSANVSLTSDYRFRGISSSNKDPAVQGGIDVSHESGLFVGTWASSIATYGGSNMELDVYGGYSGSAGAVDYTLTALVYLYPGGSGVNYAEFSGSFTTAAGPATVGVDLAWVPSQDNFGGDNFYIAGKGEVPLGGTKASLFGHFGYENGDAYFNKLDWEAGISYSAGPLTASLSYVDSDYSGINQAGRLATAGLVASVTATF
ncbi:TorF family putative porin [Novosphingobium album (ex Hu et al. 2023)]|uniref:TorF family putative porin n=1 Tax=Novosphingobium album (ex Hu et al. 2023) TaxID=2930093 RepID=A0ABT0AXV6_9SPHN|nr:TorF family putative porin [Novosphingobium album (ex Hu et al. 2023)]MCJ2177480.1 TorF family putative porin [Novosphingobium album (ex Hu et al. 2023)]